MCTGAHGVVVAVAHPALRGLIVDLLERDADCWRVRPVGNAHELADALAADEPALLILDDADFADFGVANHRFPHEQIIVVGSEPDAAYERAARQGGAGAWLFGDRVGEELVPSMRSVLGCAHHPVSTAITTER